MNEHQRRESFTISIPRGFAYRLLGMAKAKRKPRESVLEMFEEEYQLAQELIDPQAVMRFSHGGLPGSNHIDAQMPLVVVVCTIGPALEERVSHLAEEGDVARAVVLDAIGSSAAEGVADASNQMICGMLAPTDFDPDSRRSPGYRGWDVREQRVVFDYLDAAEIGVTLTETCMMTPRKSISYVVPLEGGKPGAESGHRCAHCGMDDCPYRSSENNDSCDFLGLEGGWDR